MTNRAAVLHAPRDVRVEERPVPEPGPLDVLVEIAAVGVCGSDVHYYEHGRIATRVVRAPHVLGHESAGRVVATGDRVTKHRIGDRVALEPGLPCGRCRECRAGRYNLCRDVRFLGAPPTDSGSISAPSSSLSASGSANAKSSWIGTNSANAPSTGGVAKKTTSAQRL
jgi:L-iditol 2-dehydrogenase